MSNENTLLDSLMEEDNTLLDSLMEEDNTLLDSLGEEDGSLASMLGMEEQFDDALLIGMAESGDTNAMIVLGNRYLKGDGMPEDRLEGMYWLEKSGLIHGLLAISNYLSARKEESLAEEYYLTAENMVDTQTPVNEQTMIYQGLYLIYAGNQKKNLKKARDYFFKLRGCGASEKMMTPITNHVMTEHYLCLGTNKASEEEREEAAAFVETMAEYADAKLARYMFLHYVKKQNFGRWEYWVNKAADDGDARAQAELAIAYLGKEYNSKNITHYPKDIEKSRYYLDLAISHEKLPEELKKLCGTIRESVEYEEKIKDDPEAAPYPDFTKKEFSTGDMKKALKEMKKNGSTKLVIPEGYTHIEHYGMNYRMYADIKKVTEIVYPDTMLEIPEAFGLVECTKVQMGKNVRRIHYEAFSADSYGGFLSKNYIHGTKTMEKIVIPKGAVLSSSFSGIGMIKELIFEEGKKYFNWAIVCGGPEIKYLYVPDSVKEFKNFAAGKMKTAKIEKLSVPARFKELILEQPFQTAKEYIWR